jgi:hypothetical protein
MSAGEAESPLGELLGRLESVGESLSLAASGAAEGLTDAEPGTGERWDAGQLWAHVVEFVPYWIEEGRKVLDLGAEEPVPFGRVKTDPGRIASIENLREIPVQLQSAATASNIRELRWFLREIDEQPGGWEREGLHQKLGVMRMTRIVEEFLVGHLEEHLHQLERLGGS